MSILSVVLRWATNPATLGFARKLGGVWIVSFFAASGGIWARRWHKEKEPPPPDYQRRRREWQASIGRRRP